jgi:ABC-type amino acid transport substrate-binding protein
MLASTSIAAENRPHHATLAIGISADGAPYAFTRAGVLMGLEIDLARALATALERELRLQRLPEGRLIDALRGGRIDLMFSRLPPADLNAFGLTTSTPVLATGQMALLRSDDLNRFPRLLDLELSTARIGYERGSLGARLVQARFARAERVPLAGPKEGLAALRAGQIDLFIHDATTAWRLAADPRETELTALYRPLTHTRLRVVLRSEDRHLKHEIDRILAEWHRSGRLKRLIGRWVPVQIRVG